MYALFSQQKLVYQGLLGAAQTELMDITHQHENLALRDSGLKARLSTIQEKYANDKADLYEQLSHALTKTEIDIIEGNDTDKAGDKLTGHIKCYDQENTPEYYTKRDWLIKSHGIDPDSYKKGDLVSQYGFLTREDIDIKIQELDAKLASEEAVMNKQIDETARKETRLDTEKASLETKITDYQKQLEKVEEAEGKGIEASIGKFQGVG